MLLLCAITTILIIRLYYEKRRSASDVVVIQFPRHHFHLVKPRYVAIAISSAQSLRVRRSTLEIARKFTVKLGVVPPKNFESEITVSWNPDSSNPWKWDRVCPITHDPLRSHRNDKLQPLHRQHGFGMDLRARTVSAILIVPAPTPPPSIGDRLHESQVAILNPDAVIITLGHGHDFEETRRSVTSLRATIRRDIVAGRIAVPNLLDSSMSHPAMVMCLLPDYTFEFSTLCHIKSFDLQSCRRTSTQD